MPDISLGHGLGPNLLSGSNTVAKFYFDVATAKETRKVLETKDPVAFGGDVQEENG
jgi:hypothetical protein